MDGGGGVCIVGQSGQSTEMNDEWDLARQRKHRSDRTHDLSKLQIVWLVGWFSWETAHQ